MFRLVGLLFVIGLARGGDVGFTVCDSANLTTVLKFSVSDCVDGSETCEFVMGETYTFEVLANIHSNHPPSSSLPFEVTARVFGLPFVLAEGNACDSVECPITPGEDVTITIVKQLPSTLPTLRDVPVTARVWDNRVGNNNRASLCASIRATIIDPSKA